MRGKAANVSRSKTKMKTKILRRTPLLLKLVKILKLLKPAKLPSNLRRSSLERLRLSR